MQKTVLILGANSDVAKETICLYTAAGYQVIAASRSVSELQGYIDRSAIMKENTVLRYFDAVDFASHPAFYKELPAKPAIVVYAAGFQVVNEEALVNWEGAYRMMNVHYCGAVSILSIIAMDRDNAALERIIGMSSLSGVRGRKSNFVYGSTKAAFTQYLAGLRQYLFPRKILVNVIVSGYIKSKMTAGLDLNQSLMMEPSFVARAIINAGKGFTIVPGTKWKAIYHILRLLPENLVARLP